MPELPEVETVARTLQMTIAQSRIETVAINRYDLRFPVPADLPEKIEGRTIRQVSRRGKCLVLFLEKNGVGGKDTVSMLIIHLGMSGNVFVRDGGISQYNRRQHDHVQFECSNGKMAVFHDPRRFGYIQYQNDGDIEAFAASKAMGPEPLDTGFTANDLQRRLAPRKGPVKNVLLNQQVVAGLGNIYVCEALFYAGIDPRKSAADLSKSDVIRLHHAIRNVLQRAIEAGGSTLKDYSHIDGSSGYFQHYFSVYDREGEVCPLCQDKRMGAKVTHKLTEPPQKGCIIRIVQSGRSTYYCPYSQR